MATTRRHRLRRWIRYHLLEIMIAISIVGIVAAVIVGAVIENSKPPCVEYKTVWVNVYNGKTTTLMPVRKCVRRERR